MFFEGYVASEIYKSEMPLVERKAERAWRFRNLKTKESQVLTAVLTAVLGLFVR
jgi:hypothetical protein